jgi:hypothetical protein
MEPASMMAASSLNTIPQKQLFQSEDSFIP